MDRCIVLYESKYGSTLKYAQWLSQRLNCSLAVTGQVNIEDLEPYDTVILAGSIFASGILGISFIHKNFAKLKDKKLAILVVGASEQSPEVLKSLEEMNLCDKLGAIPCFYARGAWHQKEMKLQDRMMVKVILRSLKHRKVARLELWETALLGCAGQDADWTSPEQLDELVRYIEAPELPELDPGSSSVS